MTLQEYMEYDNRYKVLLHIADTGLEKAHPLIEQGDLLAKPPKSPIDAIKRPFMKVLRRMNYWMMEPYFTALHHTFGAACALRDSIRAEYNERLEQYFAELSPEDQKKVEAYEERQRQLKEGNHRVLQIVSTVNFGDAVGNDVLAIDRALKEAGYLTGIYSGRCHPKLSRLDIYDVERLPELNEEDVIIYHFASGDMLEGRIRALKCKKVLRYHNITPPAFYEPYDADATFNTKAGLGQIRRMKDVFDYGMIDSEYNCRDLRAMGHRYPMDVVPIVIPFKDYEQSPDPDVIQTYRDGHKNIVFVGRIAPNKKFEDLIESFAVYKERYDKDARLILVGNYGAEDRYYRKLQDLVKEKEVKDVIFTGHCSFPAILAYYTVADIFLCLSEHEGFCVPLIEAMFFKTPIIAYDSSAIAGTLKDAGILLKKKDPAYVAEQMHHLMEDEAKQKELIINGERRIEELQYEVVKEEMLACVRKWQSEVGA